MCQAHTVCKNVKRKKENIKFKLEKATTNTAKVEIEIEVSHTKKKRW